MVLPPHVFAAILPEGKSSKVEVHSAKGPVFATAIIAGVMAAKNTSNLIPFCHPIMLESCDISIIIDDTVPNSILIDCKVSTTHKTGVEMEAMVGASSASLCIYDMMKAASHDIQVGH